MLNTRKATSQYNNKICKFVASFVFILYSFVLIVQIFLETIVSDIRKQFQRLKKNGLSNMKLFTGRFILNPICSSYWIHVHSIYSKNIGQLKMLYFFRFIIWNKKNNWKDFELLCLNFYASFDSFFTWVSESLIAFTRQWLLCKHTYLVFHTLILRATFTQEQL